ncbi:MAG: homocysteine S-methyltransferase family protein [Clostridiales bacterium]|nr:homocysteine S-methyltransferase family protein [Clostridiales bacterium]
MNREEFRQLLQNGPILCDGATGTALSDRGMPLGASDETWMLENPSIVSSMQKEYIKSGARILLTPTFACNRIKLAKHGLTDDIEKINVALANITKEAANDDALVAAEMGPTGEMIAPMGMLTFDEVYAVFLEQAKVLLNVAPDLFMLETFMSLDEIRAAVLAIRSICELPIVASMTFENTHTLMGNSASSVAITLVAAGADCIGCNCSSGPADLKIVLDEMKKVVEVPLFAKPNAGIPQMSKGKTVFPLQPDEFAKECRSLLKIGVHLIGGCCGTGPKHIQKLNDIIKEHTTIKLTKKPLYICGPRKEIQLSIDMPLTIIGERINPTGQEALSKDFVSGNCATAISMATAQIKNGASILDINVSAPGVNQPDMMYSLVENLSATTPSALCIDSPEDDALEKGLYRFPGKAILNSITGEATKCEKRLALAAKYGAVPIILPIDDSGLPATAEDRMKILDTILLKANEYDITKDEVIVDAMIMAIASGSDAMEAVKFVAMCHQKGILTVVGLSNVSFGLPNRTLINNTYLSMLAGAGLNLVIANPNDKNIIQTIDSINALRGHDDYCINFVKKYK